MPWWEPLGQALSAAAAASQCRPEQQGLLVAAVIVLLIAVLVAVPFCCCAGCLIGTASGAVIASPALRRTALRLARVLATEASPLVSVPARARLSGYHEQ